jgi:hypothetical protein
MSKKIITIDEFFKLKEMLRGSPEDQEIAFQIYDSQYKDRDILDTLMVKGLVFKDRQKFADAVKYVFPLGTGQNIYAYIEERKINMIYKLILDKLMGHD